MYEDLKEYLNWYDTRSDMKFPKDAPVIGLVLQRSHLVTGDEGHYSGVVAELEARGAKVGFTDPNGVQTQVSNGVQAQLFKRSWKRKGDQMGAA